MKPVNNKSLLAFLFDQMEQLNSKEIDVETAKAQANLAKQVNNAMRYELDLVATKIKMESHNQSFGSSIELRNPESKNFE